MIKVSDYTTADGTTNNTSGLLSAIAAMPANGAELVFENTGYPYMIDSGTLFGLNLDGKAHFLIEGNQSVIKVINGSSCVGGYNMFSFWNNADGLMQNFVLDGNRANRSPNLSLPTGAYNVGVFDNCQRVKFRNVRGIHSVIDAFVVTVTGGNAGNQSAYPTDIEFDDCSADDSVRNGLSACASKNLVIRGGNYRNSNGATTGPCSGIDLEPDGPSVIYGNQDTKILGVETSGNAGYGITLWGDSASPNTRTMIRAHSGTWNTSGLLSVVNAVSPDIEGSSVSGSGTWSPQFKDGGVTGIGTTVNYATWVKTNGIMHIRAAVTRNDASSLSGQLVLSNYPYPQASDASYAPSGGAWVNNTSGPLSALVHMNGPNACLLKTSNAALMNTNEWINGRPIYFSATYPIG